MIRHAPPERAFAERPCFGPSADREAMSRLNGPLAGLRGSAIADRFCAWSTRSGRRIIVSVIPLEADTVIANLPLREGIVLAVRRASPGPRRVLWAEALGPTDRGHAIENEAATLARAGGYELHLHLLASDAAEVLKELGYPRLRSTWVETVREVAA